MSDIIDLTTERNRRAAPDEEFVKRDDFGREMFAFLISYEMADSPWSTHIWAYDEADAQARVDAMRQSLVLDGKVFSAIRI